MVWSNIFLPATAQFPDGTTVQISYIASDSPTEQTHLRANGAARLEFANGRAIELEGVWMTEKPRMRQICSSSARPVDSLLFLGGTTIYKINKSASIEARTDLRRSVDDSEYWKIQVVEAPPCGLVVVFESVVILADQDLHVAWERTKLFNDFLGERCDDRLMFYTDHVAPWYLALPNGEIVHSPPETPVPGE